jgi:hypothetical protein
VGRPLLLATPAATLSLLLPLLLLPLLLLPLLWLLPVYIYGRAELV